MPLTVIIYVLAILLLPMVWPRGTARSIIDCLVSRGPEVSLDSRSAGRVPEALGHQDAYQVLLGSE
jgi:hypothetical protein